MNYLKSWSTHWRATCTFPTHGVDYRDYVRANFTKLDPLTFTGSGDCAVVDILNVRGHDCIGCTSGWWGKTWVLHLKNKRALCAFGASPGYISHEENFGYYKHTNNDFRCSSSDAATTNHWFGTHLTSFKSCYDYWSYGTQVSKVHRIYQDDSTFFKTICDFNSDPAWVWTLVMSHKHSNRGMMELKSKAVYENAPLNEEHPNPQAYRLALDKMEYIKSRSTHWRITCNFAPNQNVSYTDYVRANFTEFDVFNFTGERTCKIVEYLNVRGHNCTGCTSAWWQSAGQLIHHDSSKSLCEFAASPGYTPNENNFGYYTDFNPAFCCSSDASSSTNHWFGRRV